MPHHTSIPSVVQEISLDAILRIDYSLEGDWSGNVKTIWSKTDGFLSYDGILKSHAENIPSIELYFEGYWLGIHCFNRIDGQNVFDEAKSDAIIQYVSEQIS